MDAAAPFEHSSAKIASWCPQCNPKPVPLPAKLPYPPDVARLPVTVEQANMLRELHTRLAKYQHDYYERLKQWTR